MNYISLQKYGYKFNDLVEEVARRQKSPATVWLKFDQNQYFYVLVPELLLLIEQILQTERTTLTSLVSSLPKEAVQYAQKSMLVREIRSTNLIEGVHSSRREIEEAAVSPKANRRRFSEFFEVLAELFLQPKKHEIRTVEDIKELYTRVTAGELDPGAELDGTLFRKDGVDVTNAQGKVIHRGFQPEAKLITGLAEMLDLSRQPSSSKLITALLCHFMFETVHPFYDGNGRTGRVLLASHLQDSLSELTILSLSQAISNNKDLYYEALKEARDSRNFGELTGFVLDMLRLIQKGQESVTTDLSQAQRMIWDLEKSLSQLNLVSVGLSDKDIYKNVLFLVGQHYIFGSELGLSLPEIITYLPQTIGEQTLRKYCKKLEAVGFFQTTTKRPARFTLSADTAKTLGISGQLFQ